MAAPSKITGTAVKPEKPKDTGRFITGTEGWKITLAAKLWEDTPYAPQQTASKPVAGSDKYAGGNPVKKKGADCSGSVWAIYKEAGFSYGPYTNTAGFKELVGTDEKFVKGGHFFKRVSMPQAGDIGWWQGHLAIYDKDVGKTDKGQDGNVWSASSPTSPRKFGPGRIDWYDNKNGAGAVTWYRYWKAS